jgi:ribonuclease BN (tRNA processing enzyme)
MTRLFLEMNEYDIEIRRKDEGRPPIAPLIQVHELTGAGPVMRDDLVRVTAALNEHPPVVPSFAYRFDTADRSIVISGDTNVSENLIRLAAGADVLVHEVMYVPGIEELVKRSPDATRLREHLTASHTSTEDVGRVAAAAGVKTLVLSHFVPGHADLPDETWAAGARRHFKGRIVVGADLMEI